MARKRKRGGLRGLGLTSQGHKSAAKSYATFYADAVALAKRDLKKGGSCRAALPHLIMVAKSAGAMRAHHASQAGGKRALRTSRQSSAMQKSLDRLIEAYRDKCER